uniref:Uncharacterized protein n=1 Tax=Anguilla anguilla TaxID=7936 RepID=A0A0E9T3P6_ANGAN
MESAKYCSDELSTDVIVLAALCVYRKRLFAK